MKNKLISHYSAVLAVRNMDETINFYVNQLGFTLNNTFGNPINYAIISRDDSQKVMLSLTEDFRPSKFNTASLYFFSYHVDNLYLEIQSKEIEIIEPVQNHDYGMREFRIQDPNGYHLVFGQGID